MKFAQEFKKSLAREGFPQKWVDSAIPYGQLKKILKKVIKELKELGLDKETLQQLAKSQTDEGDVGFQYKLDGSFNSLSHTHFRPKLIVNLKDGVAVDAKLSPATRDFLKKVVSEKAGQDDGVMQLGALTISETSPRACSPEIEETSSTSPRESRNEVSQVEVPLRFDGEFFDILQTDVLLLDDLQEEEQERMKGKITALGNEISRVTRPSQGRKAKDDLARWRDIFELYLDSNVFFSTRESDHGVRSAQQAMKQLQWFQDEVMKRKLISRLKLPGSRDAFSRFMNMNSEILQNLKFQEINKLAVTKILKKFDKRTSLNVTQSFRSTMNSDRLLAGSIAKDLCAQVSREVISAVPQLDDYLCPICFSVAYWPIRLECQHVFCSRCMVKMQRKDERHCPLCRGDVIMKAGMENFDEARAAFLREYFPKEVKEKVKANELERNREIFGPSYSDQPCCIM